GAGLGMSIVRAVCRAHCGAVTAKALPEGGGLEVRVEIPVPAGSG
ncbi:MAG: two-component sensor histidine kinase, partial [Stackebrandtia sp.]